MRVHMYVYIYIHVYIHIHLIWPCTYVYGVHGRNFNSSLQVDSIVFLGPQLILPRQSDAIGAEVVYLGCWRPSVFPIPEGSPDQRLVVDPGQALLGPSAK